MASCGPLDTCNPPSVRVSTVATPSKFRSIIDPLPTATLAPPSKVVLSVISRVPPPLISKVPEPRMGAAEKSSALGDKFGAVETESAVGSDCDDTVG